MPPSAAAAGVDLSPPLSAGIPAHSCMHTHAHIHNHTHKGERKYT